MLFEGIKTSSSSVVFKNRSSLTRSCEFMIRFMNRWFFWVNLLNESFLLFEQGCIWKLRQLTYEAMTLQAAFFARRHLTKLISDGLLRQLNGLMIYNKIERVLVITKRIFNYYDTNFSLEITSTVQNVNQKFTHKLTTKCNFQTPSLFFSSTITEWNAQDCGISKAANQSDEGISWDRKWS